MEELEKRVEQYWTQRAKDFSTVRRNELRDEISRRWLRELERWLPADRALDVLDVGTGTGYFAILLARVGHRATGIDLTVAMLEQARETAREFNVSPCFLRMDAQETAFADGSFDAVVTRNLTWTLPDPARAYREWYRVLRPGGVLLNFDADYAQNVRNENQEKSYILPTGVYGHIGVTPELKAENARITLAMPAGAHERPGWDLELAAAAGFRDCAADPTAGARILRERDLADAPLFLLRAVKPE